MVLGYGLTKRLDIHAYYSATHNVGDNYYGGLSYQFLDTPFLDLSTAIGMRAYTDNSNMHLFLPQLLYTVKLNKRIRGGGSWVNIMDEGSGKMEDGGSLFDKSTREKKDKSENIGVAKDVFLMVKVYENEKYKIDITAGRFSPVLWEPKGTDWYPTYSLDFKIK